VARGGLTDTNDAEFFDWGRAYSVRLGHDVWIGHGAVVLPGVTVGTGAVPPSGNSTPRSSPCDPDLLAQVRGYNQMSVGAVLWSVYEAADSWIERQRPRGPSPCLGHRAQHPRVVTGPGPPAS
jgi:hypothetical protein